MQQLVLRGNNKSIGWINTGDVALLENLRHTSDALYENKNADTAHLRDLIIQAFTNDFMKILIHTEKKDNNAFMRGMWQSGVIVESAPMMTKSSPEAAFMINPSSEAYIIGSWERLFISIYEPFAYTNSRTFS